MGEGSGNKNPLGVRYLLRPHLKYLLLGVLVILGGSIADVLQPWPLKIVIDTVLQGKGPRGWLAGWVVSVAGADKLATLRLAAMLSLGIAAFGAACSYFEKSLTTTIGQRVLHDLRKTLYYHIQRLSLAYHDRKR